MKNLFVLPLFFASILGAPITTYDQRQDGEVNVRADLQNFVVVALVPKIDGSGILQALSKTIQSRKALKNIEKRRDNLEPDPLDEPEPFLEPKSKPYHESELDKVESKSKPYQVDISQAKYEKIESKSNPKENPVPDVVPVKDNKYVIITEDLGKKEIDVVEVPLE